MKPIKTNKSLAAAAVITATMIASMSPSSALGLRPIADLNAAQLAQPGIIKVHSRRRAHDMLHDYGYRDVYFLRKRRGYGGNPINVYIASRGRREYHISVDWYGNIVDRHRADRCYRAYR